MTKRPGGALRVWAGLALMALELALPSVLDANPLGRGLLELGGSGMTRGLAHQGYTLVGPFQVQQTHKVESNVGFYAALAAPLWEWGGLLASGSSGQTQESWAMDVPAAFSALHYSRRIDSADYVLGARIFPWAWTRDYATATDGNPDGLLYWPVLTVAHEYSSSRALYTVSQASGAWGGYKLLDEEQFVWAFVYRLVLPLHRRASLKLGYDRDQHAQVRIGERIKDYDGARESVRVGASFWIPVLFDHDGFAERYFPGRGWYGEVQVDLGYGRSYDLALGRISHQDFDVSLGTPLSSSVAVSLGYGIEMAEELYFAGQPGFVTILGNTDKHSVNAAVTMSFGGLGWF